MRDKNELLSKLKKLAEQGVDGEQEQATKMFDKLCKKYNIDDTQVDTESVELKTFSFKAKDKQLFIQVVCKVLNESDIKFYLTRNGYTKRFKRTELSVYCTEEQSMQINFLFDFYSELYEQDLELFFRAFIEKHNLFSDVPVTNLQKAPSLSLDELVRMNAMMNGMSDKSPTLRITSQSTSKKPKKGDEL
ncbi:MAG: hypothetical protein ACI4HM_00220 [Ruminococcus sp.]